MPTWSRAFWATVWSTACATTKRYLSGGGNSARKSYLSYGGILMKTLYLDCAMGAAGDTRRTIGARFVGRGRNVKKTCLCRHVKKICRWHIFSVDLSGYAAVASIPVYTAPSFSSDRGGYAAAASILSLKVPPHPAVGGGVPDAPPDNAPHSRKANTPSTLHRHLTPREVHRRHTEPPNGGMWSCRPTKHPRHPSVGRGDLTPPLACTPPPLRGAFGVLRLPIFVGEGRSL